MSWSPATVLLTSSVAALVFLAPLVPDEPFHLSGVMVVGGIVLAFLAFAAGAVEVTKATGPEGRSNGKIVMLLSALTILGAGAVLVARLMAQLS